MMQSRNLYRREDDKEKQSYNPSLFTDMSRICDEVLSHEGGSSPQINTFFNFLPSGISPHKGGICLLGSVKEKEDVQAEAHEESEALVSEILSERMDVSLENDVVGPFIGSSKYQPDSSPEEGSSGHLSHKQMTEYTVVCRVFYDPIVEYMERLGNGNDWSHLYCKY